MAKLKIFSAAITPVFILHYIYIWVIYQTLLSKVTDKWGHYRSNQNEQKSNNMQVLLQVLVSLTQYT